MSLLYTTDAVPEKERVEYWQELASRIFLGMRMERNAPDPFFGELGHRKIGHLSVTYLNTASKKVYRGRSEIARSSRENYYICMQLTGTCTVRSGREEQTAQAGDIELLDGTRPGELSFATAYRRIAIAVPHSILRPRLADPDLIAWRIVPSHEGMGALASAYLRAFAHAPLPEAAAEAASDILVDLLALAFNTPADRALPDAASVREARRHTIRTYVERHLADPALSPARVAAHFRMSTRYLHGLFSESGVSLMRWVLSRRLAHCRKDLSTPVMHRRNIADIAFSWGFQDLSHFGRAFKVAFGMTPRECRTEAARKMKR